MTWLELATSTVQKERRMMPELSVFPGGAKDEQQHLHGDMFDVGFDTF